MTPAVWNITIVHGDSYAMQLRMRSSDGTYIDLTGATVRSQIRYRPNGLTMAEFTVALMDQTSPDGLGGISLTLTPAQTADLRNGVYDVEIDWPSGRVQTCLAGQTLIQEDITRAVA